MEILEYKHKGWSFRVLKYLSDNFNLEIIDPDQTPKPKHLFKHYALNEYSIEALTNNYLFASHPFHFNDPYDCNKHIFDLSNTPCQLYTNYLKNFKNYNRAFIQDQYNSNHRKDLDEKIINEFWHLTYSKCGIISLSDLHLNIQMWAYYSKLNGFQITLKTNFLPENFKGPIKVRYTSDFDKIPVSNDLFLPTLYQISNKEINWSHESEWRYLVVGPDEMEVPFSVIRKHQRSPHDRKFKYNPKALLEITLGYNFFHPDETKAIEKNKTLFDLSEPLDKDRDLKIELLDFIIQNPYIKVMYLFKEKVNDFKLHRIPCKIFKTAPKVFEMKTYLK